MNETVFYPWNTPVFTPRGVCGDKNNFCPTPVLSFSCLLLLVKPLWYHLDMLTKTNHSFITGTCLAKLDPT